MLRTEYQAILGQFFFGAVITGRLRMDYKTP
jgi:hypothetical protein